MRVFWFLSVCSIVLWGCKSNCRILSESLCDCAPNSNARTSCLQRVASNETNMPGSAEDEVVCEALLPGKPNGCDCRLIDTPAGKMRCGLAQP
jgi:hypothetical protein